MKRYVLIMTGTEVALLHSAATALPSRGLERRLAEGQVPYGDVRKLLASAWAGTASRGFDEAQDLGDFVTALEAHGKVPGSGF